MSKKLDTEFLRERLHRYEIEYRQACGMEAQARKWQENITAKITEIQRKLQPAEGAENLPQVGVRVPSFKVAHCLCGGQPILRCGNEMWYLQCESCDLFVGEKSYEQVLVRWGEFIVQEGKVE